MANARPLALRADSPTILVRSLPERSILSLKTCARSPTTDPRIAFDGWQLPSAVGATSEGPPKVLCVGPRDWLLIHPSESGARIQKGLSQQFSSQGLVLVDLTAGLLVFEVSGARARNVLTKSCGLDFEPRLFSPGRCARTRFAQIPVVIDSVQGGASFELYVPRSYDAYLQDWLEDASLEFQSERAR
jgi:sarcosine oxidase, subunit gamma